MLGTLFSSEEKYGPRLTMSLCHCSSEDGDHPARALRHQVQNSTGWQSDKGCVYPQELGFAFEGEVELHFIRVLSHERKIASRIEVFIAEATKEEIENGTIKPYHSSNFRRLGYVCFVTTADNAFGARELKTINIRQKCVYVKLLISRPYSSDYNLFHQVGIVALTSHGTIRRTYQGAPTRRICLIGETVEVPLDEMLPPRLGNPQSVQPQDDIGLEIDQVTARRIAEIVLLKERAVAAEDYDLANALKSCLLSLERVGKKLYYLEKEKATAVKEEDYASAKNLKRQIDNLREEAYRIPTSVPEKAESCKDSNRLYEPSSGKEPPLTSELMTAELRGGEQMPSVHAATPLPALLDESPVGGRDLYMIKNSDNPMRFGKQGNLSANVDGNLISEFAEGKEEWERSINRVIRELSSTQDQASVLQGEALTEARNSENVFGAYCCACLFGKKGLLREAAIRAIISPVGFAALCTHSHTVIEALLSYMALPSRGLCDPVAGVVFACCEALQAIIKDNIPDLPPVSALISHIQRLLPALVIRLGDNNSRIREMAESVLMSFSDLALEPVVSSLLVDPGKDKKRPVSPKVHVARMNMLSSLFDRYGINGDESVSLEVGNVLSTAVLNCLQHSNGEVREAASRLFAKALVIAPTRSACYMEALKPAQQNLVEQQMETLKATAQRVMTQDELVYSATLNSSAVLDENEMRPAGRNCQSNSEGRSAHIAARKCQFCGQFDENFSEAALDIHFIRACPMLCPCPLCDQVTEIATLQQHLTTECENRHLVRECPICREAVRVEDINKHVALNKCIKAVPTHSVCPLCHARFETGLAGWVAHLASPPGCPNNPRKYDGSGPQVR
ncbi:centrosomal protein of 104 kDa [Trypanosoma cruzi]|uniref:Centrosomal protein of 104 kDa n=1 Tax=Trypanosoma cruzi TaxID=5693 RepID=A0A7J6YHM4_TRYCR|nr:centrosomal protein of 104 kDa [Trypanosoma cruzi]KAF5225886.1 centrosomal protein of 104 kDa [Trypanosoma cruzi]